MSFTTAPVNPFTPAPELPTLIETLIPFIPVGTVVIASIILALVTARLARAERLFARPAPAPTPDFERTVDILTRCAQIAQASGRSALAEYGRTLADDDLNRAVRLAAQAGGEQQLRESLESLRDERWTIVNAAIRRRTSLATACRLCAIVGTLWTATLMTRWALTPWEMSSLVAGALGLVLGSSGILAALGARLSMREPINAAAEALNSSLITEGLVAITAGRKPDAVFSILRTYLPETGTTAAQTRRAA